MAQAQTISDLVHTIAYHPSDRLSLFRSLDIAEKGAVLELSTDHIQESILNRIDNSEVVELMERYDFCRVEHFIMRITSERRRAAIVAALRDEIKHKLEVFLGFSARATDGLLNQNFILVPEITTIGDVADRLEEYRRKTGKLPEILVERDGQFVGAVAYEELIRNPNRETMRTHIMKIHTVVYDDSVERLIETVRSSPHSRVVVVDTSLSVLGVVYSDDVLSLLGIGNGSLYNFAGVDDAERPFDSVTKKVNSRYKWLMINLATAFLAAAVVGAFESTLTQLVVLAAYMPIIAGMGGNAATQTLAVLVRGIAAGEISLSNGAPAVKREAMAGLVNGILNGMIVAVVALVWNHDLLLGLVVALSMVVNLVVAGFFGALVPLVMKSFGKDPATSATIFITTATDVLGFISLLGLATWLLL